jgi:hypothetical protein
MNTFAEKAKEVAKEILRHKGGNVKKALSHAYVQFNSRTEGPQKRVEKRTYADRREYLIEAVAKRRQKIKKLLDRVQGRKVKYLWL